MNTNAGYITSHRSIYRESGNISNLISSLKTPNKTEYDTGNFSNSETMKALGNISDDDYEYVYDYNAAIAHLPINEVVPVTIIYSITLLSGLIGNMLVIISVARFKKMQNTTNTFLLSLSTADLLLIVVCVPVKVGEQSLLIFLSMKFHL